MQAPYILMQSARRESISYTYVALRALVYGFKLLATVHTPLHTPLSP